MLRKRTIALLFAGVAAIAWITQAQDASAGASVEAPNAGWLTLLPPILAIAMALVFRQVVPALFAGIWVGAWIIYGDPFSGLLRTVDVYAVGSLADTDHTKIVLFTLLLGGMVGKKLVAQSDVVCENFRPGTLEKWGLGWDVLSRVNQKLILLRVSGYGQDGPYRDRPGFARIAHAYAGLVHLAGMPGGPPVTPGSTSLADYITGLYGAIGVLMALRHRDRTGQGQVIDLSLYESIFRVLDELAPAYAQEGIVRGPEGTKTLNAVPHGHYEAKDGKWLAIACTSDVMFARLADMMERPELAAADKYGEVSRRLENFDAVDTLVGDYIKGFARDDFIARCVEFEVPAAPVNSIADIFADPHFKARGTMVEVPDMTGNPVTMPNVVPRLSESPGKVTSTGPLLGDATERVLGKLCGLDAEQIARLREKGVV